MPKYSFYILPFKAEPLSKSAGRLARLGYDAIEVPGEPTEFDVGEVKRILLDHGLQASAVTSKLFGPDRDLTVPDPKFRAKARDYLKALVDMAALLGAPGIILAPTAVRRTMPESTLDQEWRWAIEGIGEISAYAKPRRVSIIIEAWNRYETHLLNRLEQADRLRRDIGMDNVGIMGDLFHMNIEEADTPKAIREFGSHLLNIHCADSNRKAPGQGHLDFVPIMEALQAIKYQHYVSVEYLPPRFIMEFGVPPEFYDTYAEETIRTLRFAWDMAKERHSFP